MEKQNLIEEAETAARNEGTIKAADLIKEIEPHFREFYLAEVENLVNSLLISFRNGQKFSLAISEITED